MVKYLHSARNLKLKENPLHVLLYSGSDKILSIKDGKPTKN